MKKGQRHGKTGTHITPHSQNSPRCWRRPSDPGSFRWNGWRLSGSEARRIGRILVGHGRRSERDKDKDKDKDTKWERIIQRERSVRPYPPSNDTTSRQRDNNDLEISRSRRLTSAQNQTPTLQILNSLISAPPDLLRLGYPDVGRIERGRLYSTRG